MTELYRTTLALLLFLSALPVARAQISPGPLSKAHQSLSGPLNCTECHAFGAGAPTLKCLACHDEIRVRLQERRGFHGRNVNASKGDADCTRCHTEHYGEDFNIIKWSTTREKFDHGQTGYSLTGKHAGLACNKCHNEGHIAADQKRSIKVKDLNHTLLGLTEACSTCHEDQHRGQLGADCLNCHTMNGWKPAPGFSHDETAFPLTGLHARAACGKCHQAPSGNNAVTQYKGIAFASCAACHQDRHQGAFPGACSQCHSTAGWREVPQLTTRFDHSRTGFALAGKHAQVACLKCHTNTTFKEPVAHARCLDCHQDQHQGQFLADAGGGDCGGCHREDSFQKTTFDVARHAKTHYPLAGAHARLECSKCHAPAGTAANYHPPSAQCLDCHQDPHGGQFASAPHDNQCQQCHSMNGFQPSTFTLASHRESRFPLPGAHAAVLCVACHKPLDAARPKVGHYRYSDISCAGCHEDPHQPTGSLAKIRQNSQCDSCHSTKTWQETGSFNHDSTGFALSGAHRAVPCAECHRPSSTVASLRPVFAGTPKLCLQCHADPHAGQFGAEVNCAQCHATGAWKPSLFDHEQDSTFSLKGAHVSVPCGQCHRSTKTEDGHVVIFYKPTPKKCGECHQ